MNDIVYLIDLVGRNFVFCLRVVGFLFAVHVLNISSGGILNILGIIPRRWYGLPGILFSPFLHGSFSHLLFNSLPLIVLMNVLLLNGYLMFFIVTSQITVIGGFLTWLMGRNAIHIGASGLILGYMGYAIAFSYMDPSKITLAIVLILLYYIGSILMGLMPTDSGVSWEGHVFGFIAGGISAFLGFFPQYYPSALSLILDTPGVWMYHFLSHYSLFS
ncbi:MAG: rhomboid family intramembrane serine protease [Gammaproteobacteria bacterium]|jgi:membrane associated rhomboid family serine protease|nr:rhomboid family intramembrane serine protease [Gammaproteobacteria bacterium]